MGYIDRVQQKSDPEGIVFMTPAVPYSQLDVWHSTWELPPCRGPRLCFQLCLRCEVCCHWSLKIHIIIIIFFFWNNEKNIEIFARDVIHFCASRGFCLPPEKLDDLARMGGGLEPLGIRPFIIFTSVFSNESTKRSSRRTSANLEWKLGRSKFWISSVSLQVLISTFLDFKLNRTWSLRYSTIGSKSFIQFSLLWNGNLPHLRSGGEFLLLEWGKRRLQD